MQFDFTSLIDRRGKDSTAVEGIGRKIWGNEPDAYELRHLPCHPRRHD